MFLFKVAQANCIINKNIRVNRLWMMLLLLILASCSSVQKNNPSSTNQNEGAITTPLNTTTTLDGSDKNINKINNIGEMKAQPMSDPMADIQINAEIKRAYVRVSKLNKNKKYQDGLNELDKIKLKYPQLSGPDYQKSRLYLNQSKYPQALDAVELSLKNNARNYYSLNLKGLILKEMGKFKEAKSVYLKAIAIYHPYANSHLNLGVLSDLYTGELELALVQYKLYLDLNLDNKKEIKRVAQVKNWVVELERRINAEQNKNE